MTMNTDTNEQPVEALESWPTDAQLNAAGIERDVWNDPESWDSVEYAFFWEHEAREIAERDLTARAELAEMFQVPATWATILDAIRRSRSVSAATGDEIHWQLSSGVEETMCGISIESEEGIRVTLVSDRATCKACDAAAWGYKCGRADATTASSPAAQAETNETASALWGALHPPPSEGEQE